MATVYLFIYLSTQIHKLQVVECRTVSTVRKAKIALITALKDMVN